MVTLEIGDWNLVATNVFVHGRIPVIILAGLCHLLRDHVVHKNWLLLRHLLSDELAVDLVLLLTSTRPRIIILLLLHALDLLKLLLELVSLLVDVLVQYLLVLLDLVNDVLLVPHVHKILLLFSRAYLRVDTGIVVSNSITAEEAHTLVAGEAWLAILLPSAVRRESSDVPHLRGGDSLFDLVATRHDGLVVRY